jgi:hypothetical protein
MATLWKVSCLENVYPGMWQRWFKNQCVGIGWNPANGHRLHGDTKTKQGWSRARKAISEVSVGDYVVVTLKNHRVGRLGMVTGKNIEDGQWDPLVPPSLSSPYGEMGRRILVRWDLNVGPDSRDSVVALPPAARFSTGELRPTICKIQSQTISKLKRAMNDENNWVGLLTQFDYERALSGYIAAYPHRLEDGLLPHPNERVRERVFGDKSRSDVLLTDRSETPVVVECKQGSPTLANLKQLRNYMNRLKIETGKKSRGILVHGGARKLSAAIAVDANKKPKVELVQYSVEVEFTSSR